MGLELPSYDLVNAKRAATYFAMRQLNIEARQAKASPRLSAADQARITGKKSGCPENAGDSKETAC